MQHRPARKLAFTLTLLNQPIYIGHKLVHSRHLRRLFTLDVHHRVIKRELAGPDRRRDYGAEDRVLDLGEGVVSECVPVDLSWIGEW